MSELLLAVRYVGVRLTVMISQQLVECTESRYGKVFSTSIAVELLETEHGFHLINDRFNRGNLNLVSSFSRIYPIQIVVAIDMFENSCV
jgi:hypothetical protein